MVYNVHKKADLKRTVLSRLMEEGSIATTIGKDKENVLAHTTIEQKLTKSKRKCMIFIKEIT